MQRRLGQSPAARSFDRRRKKRATAQAFPAKTHWVPTHPQCTTGLPTTPSLCEWQYTGTLIYFKLIFVLFHIYYF